MNWAVWSWLEMWLHDLPMGVKTWYVTSLPIWGHFLNHGFKTCALGSEGHKQWGHELSCKVRTWTVGSWPELWEVISGLSSQSSSSDQEIYSLKGSSVYMWKVKRIETRPAAYYKCLSHTLTLVIGTPSVWRFLFLCTMRTFETGCQ